MLGVMPADSKANFYSPHSVHFQDRRNNTEHFPATVSGTGLCGLIVVILKTSFNAGMSWEAFYGVTCAIIVISFIELSFRNRQVR